MAQKENVELFETAKTKTNFYRKVWAQQLIMIEARKFEYLNLPPNLPAWEIERRLIEQGFTAIFKHPIYGIVTSYGGKCGVGIYNQSTAFNWAQATLGSGHGIDGVDGVLMYNSSLDKTQSGSVLRTRLEYYTTVIADIDVSLSLISINSRAMNTVGAKTDNAVNAINLWYKKLLDGEIYVPLLESGVFDEVIPMISRDCADARQLTDDLDKLKTAYLKQFYNSCGIQYIEQKSERVITDEIAGDKDMLSISLYDQLIQRREGVAKVNALYGTNISVRVANDIIT